MFQSMIFVIQRKILNHFTEGSQSNLNDRLKSYLLLNNEKCNINIATIM